MHSPEVLAFSIRSPFPSMKRKIRDDQFPKWQSPIRYVKGRGFRYSPFMRIAGYEFYFDSWVDVWHMEPNGADSLTVCKNRVLDADGKFVRFSTAWKWHFWHYKVSPSLLYKWRRYLFTRCAECGGPSRKGNMVNHSDGGWYGAPKTPLWCGSIKVYHAECLSKVSKARHDLIHNHEKESCYVCSGAASFKINRGKADAIPEPSPKMPEAQLEYIEDLRIVTELGLTTKAKALASYNKRKKSLEWL